MTTPINNYNALLASQMYPASKSSFKGQNQEAFQAQKVYTPSTKGVEGANPFGGAQPVHRAEAYEGQGMVSAIAQNKAAMAKVGLGGNPHATETTGNRLNVTEYDMVR